MLNFIKLLHMKFINNTKIYSSNELVMVTVIKYEFCFISYTLPLRRSFQLIQTQSLEQFVTG